MEWMIGRKVIIFREIATKLHLDFPQWSQVIVWAPAQSPLPCPGSHAIIATISTEGCHPRIESDLVFPRLLH
jgi:hypothetical protein